MLINMQGLYFKLSDLTVHILTSGAVDTALYPPKFINLN